MPKTLDELKCEKIAEIKAAYLAAEDGPFNTGIIGKAVKLGTLEELEEVEIYIKSNLDSRDHMQLLKEAGMQEKEGVAEGIFVIRDANNRYVMIDLIRMGQLMALQRQRAVDILHRKWMLQERVENCQTEEEVQAINWDTNWDELDTKGE